jgi:hypothetical protein
VTDWPSFNLLRISTRQASCCNQRTSEKKLANSVPVFQAKKKIEFFSSVATLSSEPYQWTANELRCEKSKFLAQAHIIIEQLKSLEFQGHALVKVSNLSCIF